MMSMPYIHSDDGLLLNMCNRLHWNNVDKQAEHKSLFDIVFS